MRCVRGLPEPGWLRCAALIGAIALVGPACVAQSAPTNPPPEAAALQNLSKNPALTAEFAKLAERIEREVQLPAPREESRLLPLLPESSTFYMALPNYGDAAHQALGIFQQELQASPALREWWQQAESKSSGTKVEDSIEKFCEISQYLGDEVAISGAIGGHHANVLVLAAIRKPGLKGVLQQMLRELPPSSSTAVHVLDPQELATAQSTSPKREFFVLVRPDFVVASSDLTTLRSFNAHLDSGQREFVSTPFGERVAEMYRGGAAMVGAADLHTIINQIPHGTPQGQMVFQRSGFADMKYLVWKQNRAAGVSESNGELSFSGPRHGIASWLGAPGPMPSLNFASPSAVLVSSMRLKNPAEMFDDVWEIATATNPNACTAFSAFEQMLGVNIRDDLLGQLTGEITIELDGVAPKPSWRTMLGVKDAARLQQTLNKLLTAGHVVMGQTEERGTTYYTLAVPSGRTATQITYAYVPGYMIVSPSHDAIAAAVLLQRSGGSLGKSAKFLQALPPGHPSGASALTYQDPVAMALLHAQQMPAGTANPLLRLARGSKPGVACIYGEPTVIREASTSAGLDAGAALVVAAIAIPNLLRSKMAANEASALGTVRSVVTAELTYASIYPYRHYAPDLATLGPNPNGPSNTADHAALLDASIANPSCTAGAWCTKAGFRFALTATCNGQTCSDFVVVGTPAAADRGTRSFCAAKDGVIRFKTGAPLNSPISPAECRAWAPIQ